MSHVAKIELEINDLGTLRKACERLGLEWKEGQKQYAWFGRHVGDYPLPEGFTAADMGKCDHAITVPGASYELGVVSRGGKHTLLWDFWNSGGLERKLGKDAGRLKQAYTIERTRREARIKGFSVTESTDSKTGSTRLKLISQGGKSIIIDVDVDSKITLQTMGYNGKGCVKDSQFVKDLLGKETHRALTPTYWEEEKQVRTKYLTLCG